MTSSGGARAKRGGTIITWGMQQQHSTSNSGRETICRGAVWRFMQFPGDRRASFAAYYLRAARCRKETTFSRAPRSRASLLPLFFLSCTHSCLLKRRGREIREGEARLRRRRRRRLFGSTREQGNSRFLRARRRRRSFYAGRSPLAA